MWCFSSAHDWKTEFWHYCYAVVMIASYLCRVRRRPALVQFARRCTRMPRERIETFMTPSMQRSPHSVSSNKLTQAGSPPTRDSKRSDWSYDGDLFSFTRGRFVCNEVHEMSQRYIRFDIKELARLAAEAVGSNSCVAIEKYPDGMYNKALLLTMEDGIQVVAKVPNPNAGHPHFTTASEVATLEFVCTPAAFCK